jgi:NAD(P)-dependent dehydrogenase (short-subunit alcohol dehydrogenase family)
MTTTLVTGANKGLGYETARPSALPASRSARYSASTPTTLLSSFQLGSGASARVDASFGGELDR